MLVLPCKLFIAYGADSGAGGHATLEAETRPRQRPRVVGRRWPAISGGWLRATTRFISVIHGAARDPLRLRLLHGPAGRVPCAARVCAARRETRFVRCALYAQPVATSQFTKRAARAGHETLRCSAPQSRCARRPPAPLRPSTDAKQASNDANGQKGRAVEFHPSRSPRFARPATHEPLAKRPKALRGDSFSATSELQPARSRVRGCPIAATPAPRAGRADRRRRRTPARCCARRRRIAGGRRCAARPKRS